MTRKARLPAALAAVILIMSALFSGCGSITGEPEGTGNPTAAPTPEQTDEAEAKLEKMYPVFFSIISAMEDGAHYDAADMGFVWSTLFYLCSSHIGPGEGVEMTGSEAVVSGSRMRAFASACFLGVELSAKPDSESPVTYDEASDTYHVPVSDAGDIEISLMDYIEVEDGLYKARVALINAADNQLLGLYALECKTPAVKGAQFPFQVEFATETYMELAVINEVGQDTVSLSYVDTLWHAADELDENGEPYGNDWLEITQKPDENIMVRTDNRTVIIMPDIFTLNSDIDEDGDYRTTLEFLAQNCGKTYQDEPLYFKVNIWDGALASAELWWEYYFAG